MEELFNFLLSLVKKSWTGKIVLHFHQGKYMKGTRRKRKMTIEVDEEEAVKL